MAKQDTFDGVKAGLMMYDALLLGVAEQLGMERAVALQSKVMEKMGTTQGKAIKKQVGDKKFNAKTAWPLVNTVDESLGVSAKVMEESPNRVVFVNGRCPIYDAAYELGIDNKIIETMCRSGSVVFLDVMAKQLDPNLTVRLINHRTKPDGFCEHEIVMD
jgi:predicted ArsR family transcriptional regulator